MDHNRKNGRNLHRSAALLLSAALVCSLSVGSAFAAPPAPPEGAPPGGGPGGGTAAPSVNYQTLNVLGKDSAVFILDGTVSSNKDLIEQSGTISSTEISGTYISADNIGQWNKDTSDETGQAGVSGIVIKNTSQGAGAEDAILIGGPEDIFTVDGEGYNTVIVLNNEDGDQPNTLYTDAEWLIDNGDNSNCTFPGVGIAVSGNKLTLQNAFVETYGYHRPALATYDSAVDSSADQAALLIVEDSVLASWGSEGAGSSAPTFTCLYGSARPVIINASADAYFFNSQILSSDWGSYSLDQCSDVTDYIVNSFNENTVGGYGVYAIGATNTINMYGTTSVSAQYGGIVCAGGNLHIYNLSEALGNSELMGYYDGTMTLDDALNEGGGSQMIGINNALTFTADISGADVVSTVTAEDTYFSTLEADAVALDGTQLVNVMDSYDWLTNYSAITNGAPYFFLNYIDGSTLCYRSVNSVLDLDNCQLESKTGTVIQTVLGYDTSAHGIDVPDGTEYAGYDFTLSNMDVDGDILHEDYQRIMDLTLDNTDLTGAVVTGTMASWNSGITNYVDQLWNSNDPAVGGSVAQAAANAGINKEDTIATLIKNDSYNSFYGVDLTLSGNSVWTVTGTSSLSSLTVEEGSEIKAGDGKALTIYTGVDMSNVDETFDTSTGTQVDSLPAGTYENVVIVVTDEGAHPFADVASDSWYDSAVAYCYSNGLMTGISSTAFAPDDTTTRGMVVTILYRMEGEPVVSATSDFLDVDESAWYADAIAWAAANDIVYGSGTGLFAPDTAITRQDLATVLFRYAGYKGVDTASSTDLSGYSDGNSVSSYALPAMEWAVETGSLQGSGGALIPLGDASRAQLATILQRLCETVLP